MSLRFQCFRTPTWAALLDREAAAAGAGDDDALLKVRRGWQRSAGAAVDKRVFEMLFADLDCASRRKKRTDRSRSEWQGAGPRNVGEVQHKLQRRSVCRCWWSAQPAQANEVANEKNVSLNDQK